MPEYTANAIQTVAVNQAVKFTDVEVPCTKGLVIHRKNSGVFTLKGKVSCQYACFKRYKVSYNANIAIPTTGSVAEISLALAINGEPIDASRFRVVPDLGDEYWGVAGSIVISVPKSCCWNVTLQNTSTQAILVQNANLIVEEV